MDSGKFPDRGPSIYREKEVTPFTELSPETLLKRGFTFYANSPKDPSLPAEKANVINFELAKLKKDLESRGLPEKEEPRIVISNLDTWVKGSIQAGFEVKFVRGQYEPASGKLIKNDEQVAVFQRFQVDKFFTSQSPEQLQKDGYKFVNNFPLLVWGDNLENVHPDLIQLVHDENKKIEDFIREQENSGVRVQIVKGHFYKDRNETDSGAQSVSIFVKRK